MAEQLSVVLHSCAVILRNLQVSRETQPPPLPLSQSKGFNYWLTVQRTRDGKDYEAPYKSNGDDTFDEGDKLRLNVMSLEAGYLYIFNEGPPEPTRTSFIMIYPKKEINDGSASVGDNHTVQIRLDYLSRSCRHGQLSGLSGPISPVSELESARNEALKHPQAGLTDQNLVRVKEYLKNMDAEVDARAAKYRATQEVQVRNRNDIVLTLAEFKHR